jgi:drug/metabolite transporter (DMT)-like permease
MNLLIALIGGFVASIGSAADVFIKNAITEIGELKTSFYIRVGTLIFAIPLLFFFWEDIVFTSHHFWFILVFSILDVIALLVLFNGYKVGKVSVVAPVTASYAGVSAIFGYLFLGEVFGLHKTVGLFILLIGIVLVSIDFKELRDGLQLNDFAKGLPQALIVLIYYGIGTPIWGKFIDQPGWASILIISLIVDVIVLSIIVVWRWKKDRLRFSDFKYSKSFVVASILLAGMFLGYNWGFRFSTETIVIIALASTYPATIALFSYFYLKERLAVNQYIGIVTIIIGVVLLAVGTQMV